MSGKFTVYGANAVLDGTPLPATLYIKGHLGNPSVTGTANPAVETRRIPFVRNAASGGVVTNDGDSNISTAAATEDWTYISIWDTAGPAGGNCWLVGALNSLTQIDAGQTIALQDLAFSFALDLWS